MALIAKKKIPITFQKCEFCKKIGFKKSNFICCCEFKHFEKACRKRDKGFIVSYIAEHYTQHAGLLYCIERCDRKMIKFFLKIIKPDT